MQQSSVEFLEGGWRSKKYEEPSKNIMAIYASAWVAITAVGNDIKFYIVMHVWSLCNRPLEI